MARIMAKLQLKLDLEKNHKSYPMLKNILTNYRKSLKRKNKLMQQNRN